MHEDYKLFARTTDVDFTKRVTVSGKPTFVNIDPYYLIEEATKQFGLFGKGWGFRKTDFSTIAIGDTTLLVINALFFYEGGEFPISNATKISYKTSGGYLKINEDAYKILETNTISKALSRIGFGADVFKGLFDQDAYMAELYADKVELITPQEVQKLLKGMSYYGVPKDEILKHFNISHIKDLPKASMSECEALIKKLSKKEK